MRSLESDDFMKCVSAAILVNEATAEASDGRFLLIHRALMR
jgi:hypothetical protein